MELTEITFTYPVVCLGERTITLLFAVVQNDPKSQSLVIVVVEKHGISDNSMIFGFRPTYARYEATGTVIGFARIRHLDWRGQVCAGSSLLYPFPIAPAVGARTAGHKQG